MPGSCTSTVGASIGYVASSQDETARISAGMGTLSALATAAVSADALLKRAAGSLARQRRITFDRAGGMSGLTRSGAVGVVVICCIIMAVMVSPRNVFSTVQISYKMIP